MNHEPLPEVVDYYTSFAEESRLNLGSSQLEFERTKELLGRFLPPPPARVIDVGGAAGAYAFWLAAGGYEVHLVDATPRLVEEAQHRDEASSHRLASVAIGDARRLSLAAESVDAVLLLGPLYHLPERSDRLAALHEAQRVLRAHGVVLAAGISRYAATLDGMARNLPLDPHVVNMRDRALLDGQYRNDTNDPRYFVTAYFHCPEDLAGELAVAGYRDVRVLGVEGPGWLLPDFEARWNDVDSRKDLLRVARLLEEEPSITGASAHLLAVGHKG
jgi:ubiquinone/menaquinone biosynthesis C-methylase UbiE